MAPESLAHGPLDCLPVCLDSGCQWQQVLTEADGQTECPRGEGSARGLLLPPLLSSRQAPVLQLLREGPFLTAPSTSLSDSTGQWLGATPWVVLIGPAVLLLLPALPPATFPAPSQPLTYKNSATASQFVSQAPSQAALQWPGVPFLPSCPLGAALAISQGAGGRGRVWGLAPV